MMKDNKFYEFTGENGDVYTIKEISALDIITAHNNPVALFERILRVNGENATAELLDKIGSHDFNMIGEVLNQQLNKPKI